MASGSLSEPIVHVLASIDTQKDYLGSHHTELLAMAQALAIQNG